MPGRLEVMGSWVVCIDDGVIHNSTQAEDTHESFVGWVDRQAGRAYRNLPLEEGSWMKELLVGLPDPEVQGWPLPYIKIPSPYPIKGRF